jgi:DNA-binding CsgD family transcriptional regulator
MAIAGRTLDIMKERADFLLQFMEKHKDQLPEPLYINSHAQINALRDYLAERSMNHIKLTTRQFQIAALVTEGKTNLQIAEALQISESTVKTHLHQIYVEIGVSNRTELALAYSNLMRFNPNPAPTEDISYETVKPPTRLGISDTYAYRV